jgi:catechol 2,3-dioxygenase-like lactoylglutathione lyase family enzyme
MEKKRTKKAAVPNFVCEQQHACLSVPDIAAAVDFYTTKIGFRQDFLWGKPPSFAGVSFGGVQIFLQKGAACPAGLSVFFVVDNADALYAFHQSAGVEIAEPIDDRDYNIRDYGIRDLNGYYLSFGHRLVDEGELTAGDPIPIERVDVPLRLEKRLAALLEDLAKHKRMSIDSAIEEMMLHTNDGVGPHTAATVAYIRELKKKHGIDYDSHGSYRFVERS